MNQWSASANCQSSRRTAWENWQPEWHWRYRSLQIAARVTLVGAEGVVLSGESYSICYQRRYTARLDVRSEGVSFVSLHLPRGATIGSLTAHGGSLTMTKCTSTMGSIYADKGTSLVMEDSRMFGCRSQGMICRGDVKATRCTIECMSVAAPESRPRSSWLTA